jgi:hypothetical protein
MPRRRYELTGEQCQRIEPLPPEVDGEMNPGCRPWLNVSPRILGRSGPLPPRETQNRRERANDWSERIDGAAQSGSSGPRVERLGAEAAGRPPFLRVSYGAFFPKGLSEEGYCLTETTGPATRVLPTGQTKGLLRIPPRRGSPYERSPSSRCPSSATRPAS